MSSQRTPVQPPPAFYRVQHDRSFTRYDDDEFEARGHYSMDWGHWINRRKLERHLNWEDRSPEPSPFISANYLYILTSHLPTTDDAQDRARSLRRRGCTGVFIARIDARSLELGYLPIQFRNMPTVDLPAWRDRDTGVIFLSTPDVQWHLGIQRPISQISEWFALDEIPREMILNEYQR
ncbi:hypothetical protein C8A03DRAFT_18663 [Achaetomium macrosporum]|uniref:DUF7587 domain-containing protein n=1 Tax=Achaetomium macrosporum TaxID=79813 RepID=A0AAN7HAU4_9PEZI|nr:hypothetical protein C8A03DRAFT_18663 [Achaetomium macrosporum]